jgi:hypothetical protein
LDVFEVLFGLIQFNFLDGNHLRCFLIPPAKYPAKRAGDTSERRHGREEMRRGRMENGTRDVRRAVRKYEAHACGVQESKRGARGCEVEMCVSVGCCLKEHA